MSRKAKGLGFLIFPEDLDRTSRLSDKEFREWIRSCCLFMKTGQDPEDLSMNVGLCYDFIKPRMKESKEAYDARCETNRKNRNGDDSSPIVPNRDEWSQPEPDPEPEPEPDQELSSLELKSLEGPPTASGGGTRPGDDVPKEISELLEKLRIARKTDNAHEEVRIKEELTRRGYNTRGAQISTGGT